MSDKKKMSRKESADAKDTLRRLREDEEAAKLNAKTFSGRMKIRRLVRSGRWVVLRTLDFDDLHGRYTLTETLIKRRDLPERAVHCTGEDGYYCLDLINRRYADHDRGYGALDAFLYMDSNKINDAMAVKWGSMSHVDTTKVLMIVVVAVVAIGFLLLRGH